MTHPSTKSEILAALASNADTLADYFSSLPAEILFDGDSDRWSPGHHLVHLTATAAAVERGLRSGALPLHATARSRTYPEVRDAAAASLRVTPQEQLRTMGRTVRLPAGARPSDLVRGFLGAAAALREAVGEWEADAMHRHAMTHPLMGALTVHEMLLFVVVHERHHLRNVQTRVGSSSRQPRGR